MLIAAAFSTVTDADLDFLAAYAAAGGHLLLGPKSAGGDEEGRARTQVRPARLAAAAGVAATEFANPASPVPLLGIGPFAGTDGCAIDLIEALEPSGAEVLARYEHPHFGRWAALTTNAHGSGRISVLGAVPDQALAQRLLRWLAPTAVSGWRPTASATVATSRRADGSRVHVLHNWSWTPGSANAPVALTDPASGAAIEAGAVIALGPWDVRVLVDRARSAPTIVPNEESTT